MARTITASLVLLPLLISLALGPIQNAPLASASAAASTLQQATQPGVGTARFLHEAIFGVAPASDEECEYSLDGPITGPGTHAATGPSGLGFFFESHSHASVSLALNPNFVPPPGVERIEFGFVTAIVPALSREYLVLGITTRTVNVDTTEINRVIFYDILGDDLLAELRFDPAAWAMGEFHNHSVAPGLTASESLRPDPEPAEFGPCAEACRIKYEVIADAYQQQADQNVAAAQQAFMNAFNAALAAQRAAVAAANTAYTMAKLQFAASIVTTCAGAPFTGPASGLVWLVGCSISLLNLASDAIAHGQALASARTTMQATINAALAQYRAVVANEQRMLDLVARLIERDFACCRSKCEGVPCPEGTWPTIPVHE